MLVINQDESGIQKQRTNMYSVKTALSMWDPKSGPCFLVNMRPKWERGLNHGS